MNFESKLPESQIQPWKITVVKGKKPITFVCMSKSWLSLMTHWYGGHTIVCTGDRECLACRGGVRRDFRAFVAASSLKNGQYTIMSLTASACDMLEKPFLSARGLLGLTIALHRVPARDTGMLNAMTYGYVEKPESMHSDRLDEMLSRIFSLNSGKTVNNC